MGDNPYIALERALTALDEPICCEGVVPLEEPVTITLPTGQAVSSDAADFVEQLVAHGEPAPYGKGRETTVDPDVRLATRLVEGARARVRGFDPSDVLDTIEAALSPDRHLEARLTDVLVYPEGGHFARHRDTPRSADLIATLIVGLPCEHEGGAFRVDDGSRTCTADWSGPRPSDELPWIAFYTDVDHEVERVTTGHRVTLVYALTRTDRVREDPSWASRLDVARRHVRDFDGEMKSPLLIGCARHVISLEGEQPLDVDCLRGSDRAVARVFTDCGYDVVVRACLAMVDLDMFPDRADLAPVDHTAYLGRLARPPGAIDPSSLGECVVFCAYGIGDGGGYFSEEAMSLLPFLVEGEPRHNYARHLSAGRPDFLIRETAAATFLREIDFSHYGYVGNDAPEHHMYQLAMIEVSRVDADGHPLDERAEARRAEEWRASLERTPQDAPRDSEESPRSGPSSLLAGAILAFLALAALLGLAGALLR